MPTERFGRCTKCHEITNVEDPCCGAAVEFEGSLERPPLAPFSDTEAYCSKHQTARKSCGCRHLEPGECLDCLGRGKFNVETDAYSGAFYTEDCDSCGGTGNAKEGSK
jgi:hypothetical protein